MTADASMLEPVLQREPDARRASLALLDPLALPYVALALGISVSALLALYNAIAIRRWRAAALAVAVMVGGWFVFLLVLVAATAAGLNNIRLLVLGVRLLHVLIGFLLYRQQRRYVRGHLFLRGTLVPLIAVYLAALLLSFALPRGIITFLLGVPPGF